MGTILLVDDNPFNREGMGLYLGQKGFTILEAGDADTAWRLATAHPLEAAVIDIVIPDTPDRPAKVQQSSGVALAVRLKNQYPALGIVLFSAYEDRGGDIFELVQQGVRGLAYKLKGCPPANLLETIASVQAGMVMIDPEVTHRQPLQARLLTGLGAEEEPWVRQVAARLPELTPRELDVAQRLAAAHTADSIAAMLQLTPKTVDNYVNRIYHKTGLSDLAEQAPQLRKVVLLAKGFMLYDLETK